MTGMVSSTSDDLGIVSYWIAHIILNQWVYHVYPQVIQDGSRKYSVEIDDLPIFMMAVFHWHIELYQRVYVSILDIQDYLGGYIMVGIPWYQILVRGQPLLWNIWPSSAILRACRASPTKSRRAFSGHKSSSRISPLKWRHHSKIIHFDRIFMDFPL